MPGHRHGDRKRSPGKQATPLKHPLAKAVRRPGHDRPTEPPEATSATPPALPADAPGTPFQASAASADPYISLAQFLKKIQAAGSGGEAKHLARSGAALVNGEPEARPGRKLREGDRVLIAGTEHLVRLAD
jgi:ribosome-associated protein YbcJ (S4-like RNA binding protein)